MTWRPFDSGSTIGTVGSECGTVVADFEHELGARIMVESDCSHAPFAITCGIYGWFFHTRFLDQRKQADSECEAMQTAIAAILELIPYKSDPESDKKSVAVSNAISEFVDSFP